MEFGRENFSAISKLKVAGNRTDALASRLFFERLLGGADFHPPGISQKAIICINKIDAPPLRESFFAASNDWEKSVRARVELMLRRAVRPSREAVPALAECIVFEGKAEMLACLARDWARGVWSERWWWRAVFPNLFRGHSIAEIWLDAAEFMPDAVQILSKTGDAVEMVEKLQPAEALKLLEKITAIFGLKKLNAALFETIEKGADRRQTTSEITNKKEYLRAANAFDTVVTAVIDDLKTEDLSFERQSLLETVLLLARSPRIVRSAEFAECTKMRRQKNEARKINAPAEKKVGAVYEEKRAPESSAAAKPKISRKLIEKPQKTHSKNKSSKTPVLRRQTIDETKPENPQSEIAETHDFVDQPTVSRTKTESAAKSPKIELKFSPPAKQPQKIESKLRRKSAEFIDSPAPARHTQAQNFAEFFEDYDPSAETIFETRFGGIFYLLNLGLFLGLYRDFTEAQETEIDLNIWDFTALLGLEFIGERIKSDAVWDFLKRAAEHESEADFGIGFDQFQDWRVNPGWLETFPKNQNWFFYAKSNRLVVRHPAGFNVIDAATRGRSLKQIENETPRYRKYFSEIVEAGKPRARNMKPKIWLENLAEYLQKRLFQALGAKTSKQLNSILFEQRATVSLSPTHLEITFNLADLPIEVRLAGIDRDPGWIPAAGKFVYFHFV